MKVRFQYRFQHELDNRLGNPVRNCGNTQWAQTARVFWNLYKFYRGRKVTARRHAIPDLVQVPFQALFKIFYHLAIHASSATIGFDLLVGLPDQAFGNIKWFHIRLPFFPLLVDVYLPLNSSAPSLHLHYGDFITTTS